MRKIEVPYIDYEYVGRKLCDLRQSNSNLLKYVCYSLNEERLANVDKWDASSAVCTRDMKCDDCHRPVEREVSQNELARVLGVSKTMVSNWESGRTSVDLCYLLAYCELCDVTLEEIVFP